MHAATDRLEFAPTPTPGFFRSLGLAVLAHCFLLAALTLGVQWKREAVTVTAEAELWSAVPQEAAPPLVEVPPEPLPPPEVEPTPKPVAPPEVEPPKQPDADIALEQEKKRLKKEKLRALEIEKEKLLEKKRLEKLQLDQLKQEKLQLEKKQLEDKRLKDKREQDKRDQLKKTADDKNKAAQDSKRKDAVEAQLDAKKAQAMRSEQLKRIAGLAGGTGAPDSKGTNLHSSGPSASYAGRIRARIKPNIVFADEVVGNPMAEVEVRTSPDGTIISRKLTKSSGDSSWDEAVLKAIDKTEVLPRDTDGRVPPSLVISFRPKD